METQHTSLTASKIISKALPELESEKSWDYSKTVTRHNVPENEKHWIEGAYEYRLQPNGKRIPRLSLQELIDAIQLWGEKCGWDSIVYSGISTKKRQHQLLDIYLKTKDLSSKEVDSFISNTFEV